MPGPLQVIAVSFGPGADFEGRVLAEVDRLQGRGVSRLLDVLFVAKSEDGVIERLVMGDDEDFGALLASVVPFGGVDLVGDSGSGFDPAHAWALAASLAPGTALAYLPSSTTGRSHCSMRSLRLGGRWWARVSSRPKPGWWSGRRSPRWRRRRR